MKKRSIYLMLSGAVALASAFGTIPKQEKLMLTSCSMSLRLMNHLRV